MGRNVESAQTSIMKTLQRYSWPGNVRELRNVIERNLILSTEPVFRIETQEFDQKPNPSLKRFDEVESEYFRTILQAIRWSVRGQGAPPRFWD